MRLVTDGSVHFARGVDTSPVATEVAQDEASVLYNLRVSMQGQQLEPRGRYREVDDSSNNTPHLGLTEFVTAAGAHQIVRVRDTGSTGTVEYSGDYGVTWNTIEAAAAHNDDWWSFVTIREGASNVLVGCNGQASMFQWDGSTWSTVSNAPSGAKYLEVHGERLVAAGHSGVDVAASKVGDIETWANPHGWTIKATTHDGDTEIRGLLALGSLLLVFKRASVGYIEGYGYQTLQVAAGSRGISRSVGLFATRSLQVVGERACMFLSERGFEYLEVNTGSLTLVSRQVQAFIDKIDRDALADDPGLPASLYWPEKNEYWCAVPTSVADDAQWIYVYRPPTHETPDAQTFLWIDHQESASYRTVSVGSDGYLALETDLHHAALSVGRDGCLAIEPNPIPGVFAHLANSVLTLGTSAQGSSGFSAYTMAVMDASDRPGQPWIGTIGKRLLLCEADPTNVSEIVAASSADDVPWGLVTRPLWFGDQLARKKAKRVRVFCEADGEDDVVLTLYSIVDGVRSAGQTKTVSPGGPVEVTIRVGGRGRLIQAGIYGKRPNIRIYSVLVDAQPLFGDQR